MTKKGRNPEKRPIRGITRRDSFSEKTALVKKRTEMIITKMTLGMKDDTVRP